MSARVLAVLAVVGWVFGAGDAFGGKPREWEVGAGGMAYLGGSFLDQPAQSDRFKTMGTVEEPVLYPGFAGFGAGGGISLHGMYRGFIGMEVDLFFSRDQGGGSLNIPGVASIDVNIGQTSLHMPVLIKGAIPFRTVRPFIFVGPEFVFPGEADAEVNGPLDKRVKIGANADTYTVFAYGLGMDICLPIKKVDLRIPITLRGNYNLATPTKAGDRIDEYSVFPGTHAAKVSVFNSEWQYQAAATLGVVYYFL